MPTRRQTMQAALAAALVHAVPAAAARASESTNAFNARSPVSALRALGVPYGIETSAIDIQAPDVAENGANVPVEVAVNLPNVARVLVIGEKNVFPLLADLRFDPRVRPWFEIKVKMAETSNLTVIAEAGGAFYRASRPVRVIVGGCLPG